MSGDNIYDVDDVAHPADFDTPLHQGILRYIPSDNVPVGVLNTLPAKNDRPFIFVPMGYLNRTKDDYMKRILSALNLNLPNLILVTAESKGSAEEQLMNSYRVQNPENHVIAKDWTEEHTREVLQAKVGRFLESIMESTLEVGSWILPDVPRRRNGAAQMVCQAIPNGMTGVALGLLGLNEEADDVELKKSLQDSMVPLGSPAKNVAKVVYDLDLKDGAPCPELTHLLIFESPQEKKIFRDELLNLVPDILLAFGDITEDAMHSVFENAKAGSPIILLKHTGTNVDALCRMFRHVKHTLKAAAKGSTQSPNQDDSKVKIPPIQDEENELIRLFVNTWPPGFNTESVVLADPLIMSAITLQKGMLAAITATFDLKSGGTDIRLQKRKVMTYAWAFFNMADKHSRLKKKGAETLHIELVIFTLMSIVASVLYDRTYGTSTPKSKVQLIVYVATILLPIYISNLKQESDKGADMMRWKTFKVAAAKIKSEIFKFRAQVGPYRVEEKTQVSLQRPIRRFSDKLKEIWLGVKPFLNEDSMHVPEDFWEFQRDDFIKKNDSPLMTAMQQENADTEDIVNETTPMIIKSADLKPTSDEDSDEEDPSEKLFIDDNFEALKADDYIEIRMQTLMNKKAKSVEKMSSRNDTISSTIKMITIFSGATAALHLQWCVPIILGVTAALGTGQEYRKYSKRIELGNTMVVQLNELKLWWMGLSMYQKQLPQNKDHLISAAERLIITELESSYDVPVVKEEPPAE